MPDNKEIIYSINDDDYLLMCLNMSPSERVKKGFELSEWAMKINKHSEVELIKRLSNFYLLK